MVAAMACAGWSVRLLALLIAMPCAASAQERAMVPATIDEGAQQPAKPWRYPQE